MWNESEEYALVANKLVMCSLLVFSVKLIRKRIKAKRLTGSVSINTRPRDINTSLQILCRGIGRMEAYSI
jgi:hypothetical protein